MYVNYKMQSALKKGRAVIIIAIILWLLMAILVIMPFTCAMHQMEILGGFNSGQFTRVFSMTASSPGTGFQVLIQYGLFGNYLKNLFHFYTAQLYLFTLTFSLVVKLFLSSKSR